MQEEDFAFVFNQEEYPHLKKLKRLQRYLFDLSMHNLPSAKEFVYKNDFLNNKENRRELVNNLLIVSDLRPLSVSILADFTRVLISANEDLMNDILTKVFEPIPETFNDMFSKSVEMKFLRRCMDKGVFTFLEIKSEMENFTKKYPDHVCFLLTFLCWFAPEMDSQMFIQYISLMSEQIIQKKCPKFLIDFTTDFPELRKNDWKRFRERVKYGHFMETVPYCIKYDKVETLVKLSAEYKFDLNQFIVPSIYEPSMLLREGAPLIHLAAFFGSVRCFKFLLLNNANIELRSDTQRTLAQYAVAGGNSEIIHICDHKELNFDKTLHFAALFNRNKIFEWIAENKHCAFDENDETLGTPLHQAVVGFNIEQIQNLVEFNKIDVNIPDLHKKTPLHYATICSQIDSMSLLLKASKIDPNLKDDNESTALILAAKNCKKQVINALVNCPKVDVNLACYCGTTALHLLAEEDHFKVLSEFLNIKGLNLNPHDDDGLTPLHYAAKNDNTSSVSIMCAKDGVKINAADDDGMTALHYVVINGNIRIVDELVNAKGVDINAESNSRLTPLHCAVSKIFKDPKMIIRHNIVDILLKAKGIELDIKNDDGFTPLDLAQENQFYEVASRIQKC